MLPGNKLGQHFQDFAAAEFVRDDHVEEAVIRLRVGNGLHAAADPAAVADGEDGHVLLFCLSVEGDFHREGFEMLQGGENARQIGQDAVAEILEAGSLAQHLHIEAGAGHIQEIPVVQLAHIDTAELPGQLDLQGLERILREIQHADEIVARAAGDKIHGDKMAGQAVHHTGNGPVPANADDFRLTGLHGLGCQDCCVAGSFRPAEMEGNLLFLQQFPDPRKNRGAVPVAGGFIHNQIEHAACTSHNGLILPQKQAGRKVFSQFFTLSRGKNCTDCFLMIQYYIYVPGVYRGLSEVFNGCLH